MTQYAEELDAPVNAEKIAKALNDYIAKYGLPPAMTESLALVVEGQTVYINPWTVAETK